MGEVQKSSVDQINALEITAENKAQKLKEAMGIAKNDWQIQGNEIDTLITKFGNQIDEVRKLLKENEIYITLKARTEWEGLMSSLSIPPLEKVYKNGLDSRGKNYKSPAAEAAEAAKPAAEAAEAAKPAAEAAKPAAEAAKPAAEAAKPAATPNKFDLSKITVEGDIDLVKKIYTVNASLLNVRNAEGKILSTLKKGEEVKLTGNKKGDFVETDKGYVSLKFLKEKTVTQESKVDDKGKTGSDQKGKVKPLESKESSNITYKLSSETDIKNAISKLNSSNNPLETVEIGTYIDSDGNIKNIVLKSFLGKFKVELDGSRLIYDLDLETNTEFASIKKTVEELLKKYRSEAASKKGQVDEVDNKIVIDTPTDLKNPWPEGTEQAVKWNGLSLEQKKWMGGADPTDDYIRARMPKK